MMTVPHLAQCRHTGLRRRTVRLTWIGSSVAAMALRTRLPSTTRTRTLLTLITRSNTGTSTLCPSGSTRRRPSTRS